MRGYREQRLCQAFRSDGVFYDMQGNVVIQEVFAVDRSVREARDRGTSNEQRHDQEVVILHLSYLPPSEAISEALTRRREEVDRECRRRGFLTAQVVGSLSRRVASTRSRIAALPVRRGTMVLGEAVRFGSTFLGIFTILFLVLNGQSYWQILRSRIFPDQEWERTLALERIAEPALAEKLGHVPTLPIAGMPSHVLPPFTFAVAPPDHRLIIPKIVVNVPIVEPSDAALRREDWGTFDRDLQQALRKGVVHYPGTAKPGQRGNAFYTGHSSYYPWDPGRYKDVFARLPDLRVGDAYVVYRRGRAHHYRVASVAEVMPEDTSVLEQPHEEQVSTLMTCTPVGTTLRRLIVRGEEMDPRTGERIVGEERPASGTAMPKVPLPI